MKNCRLVKESAIETYSWHGKPIYYRAGTSDCRIIYEILLTPKSDYWVPDFVNPKVILDIGANIGVASIYFAHRFPQSKIFAFEPVEENFFLLEKNISSYPNIKAFSVALGNADGEREIFFSDNPKNFGGFSFYPEGSNPSLKKRVSIRRASECLRELGITQADLIKLDTEGSEYDIIVAMLPDMLRSTRWIIGELHGVRDFDVLDYLSPWFDLEFKKTFKKRLFRFNACNKNFGCENQ